MAPVKPASLKVRALQWLAQREHSRSELRGKLLRLSRGPSRPRQDGEGAEAVDEFAGDDFDTAVLRAKALEATAPPASSPEQEVDVVLDWLTAHGYLSEVRFVESRINARQSRFGNRRIQQELQQHGVALDADARAALKSSELARAREVWRKKYSAAGADANERMRQMRFLSARGFSPDVVRQVVRGGEDDES